MKVAIPLKGTTFLRAAAPLIATSLNSGIELYVYILAERSGKEYDTIDKTALAKVLPEANLRSYADEADLLGQLKKEGIGHVVAADVPHHWQELCDAPDLTTYSISIFIDSLHYAGRVAQGEEQKRIPGLTFFPNDYLADRFFAVGSFSREEMPYRIVGSPIFDHAAFLPTSEDQQPTLLLIAPPPTLLTWSWRRQLRALFIHAHNQGMRVVVKDRVKTPLPKSLHPVVDELHTKEAIRPYASLALIANCSIHVCGYSTSVLEARYLKKPTLNLDLNIKRVAAGDLVHRFGLEDLYNSRTCITARKHLPAVFDKLMAIDSADYAENDRFLSPQVEVSDRPVASIAIWREVLSHASSQ